MKTPKPPARDKPKSPLDSVIDTLRQARYESLPDTPEKSFFDLQLSLRLASANSEKEIPDNLRELLIEDLNNLRERNRSLLAQVMDYETLEAAHQAGDNQALLLTMYRAVYLKEVPPEWAATAFIAAVDQVMGYRAMTWDEAFGPPHPKKTRRDAKRRKYRLAFPVYIEMKKHMALGVPIDVAMIKAGETFGISTALASKYYYSVINEYIRPFGLE